jgi:hypothetical protein
VVDQFTEVTHQGWFSRLGNSIKSVLVGVVLFLVAVPLLWWNEGRAVTRARSLEQGLQETIHVSADNVDPAHEGNLVHATAEATTDETVRDPVFKITAEALKLIRAVEMYQWDEEKRTRKRKKIGGGTKRETTYRYERKWSRTLIDSDRFRKRAGHENPGSMPYETETFTADTIRFGAFRLPRVLVRQIDRSESLAVDPSLVQQLPADLRGRARVEAAGIYVGANPQSPAVGDLRIRFSVVEPQTVSIIAAQAGDTFEKKTMAAGSGIALLEYGTVGKEEMFQRAQERNTMITWALRVGGFLAMAFGIGLVFSPLAVFADVIPFMGDLLRAGTALFALAAAALLSLLTIGVAWIFYRPVLAVVLIVAGLAVAVGLRQLLGRKKPAVATAPGTE